MGVYLTNMKMPKACLACDFCNPFTEEPYCRRLMKVTPKTTTLPDCPLIEIPEPHGRLGDLDDIIKQAKKWIDHPDEYIRQRNKDMIYILEREDAIIQASEEG